VRRLDGRWSIDRRRRRRIPPSHRGIQTALTGGLALRSPTENPGHRRCSAR
jgi:hypothetical protein